MNIYIKKRYPSNLLNPSNPSNPLNPPNPPNPPSPSNPPSSLNPPNPPSTLNPPSPPSPSHPLNPRFKDSRNYLNKRSNVKLTFLLNLGESLFIYETDSLKDSLNALSSQHKIQKSLQLLLYSSNNRWSDIADGKHATLLPVKGNKVIFHQILRFTIISSIAATVRKLIDLVIS